MERFCTILHEGTRPALLDLGAPCSSNINFFGKKGFKIFVEDFLQNYCEAGRRLSALPQLLNYSTAAFEGVFCWDIFDFLHPDDSPRMAERLHALLKPSGGLLALFYSRDDRIPRTIFRHKLTDSGQVLHEAVSGMGAQGHRYANREIMRIFSAFDIDKSFHHKSGYREYLFRKR
ncbi:MAG: class I SAM-dependent methyltransferase [Deltaproteobacteria bacterium]|nr:class I SAM-dependent methyltransferase [Deltaproteobacteria bacterium]